MREGSLPRALLLVACACLTVVVGCATLTWYRPPSPPDQSTSELVFSHKRHIDMEIECAACHSASESVTAKDVLLPVERTCMACHHRTQGCELCHGNANAVTPLEPRDYGLRFPHQTHLREDVNADGCDACHAAVAASVRVAETYSIGLSTCQPCHDSDMTAQERCGMCHEEMHTGSFVPVSHNAEWRRGHAAAASTSISLCDVCHRGGIRADFIVTCPHFMCQFE